MIDTDDDSGQDNSAPEDSQLPSKDLSQEISPSPPPEYEQDLFEEKETQDEITENPEADLISDEASEEEVYELSDDNIKIFSADFIESEVVTPEIYEGILIKLLKKFF